MHNKWIRDFLVYIFSQPLDFPKVLPSHYVHFIHVESTLKSIDLHLFFCFLLFDQSRSKKELIDLIFHIHVPFSKSPYFWLYCHNISSDPYSYLNYFNRLNILISILEISFCCNSSYLNTRSVFLMQSRLLLWQCWKFDT